MSTAMEQRYKVEMNASYEWSKKALELGISHREVEVFALMTEGYSNKEIAEILGINYQSVKNNNHSFIIHTFSSQIRKQFPQLFIEKRDFAVIIRYKKVTIVIRQRLFLIDDAINKFFFSAKAD